MDNLIAIRQQPRASMQLEVTIVRAGMATDILLFHHAQVIVRSTRKYVLQTSLLTSSPHNFRVSTSRYSAMNASLKIFQTENCSGAKIVCTNNECECVRTMRMVECVCAFNRIILQNILAFQSIRLVL